jgi:hypothetical protein
VLRRVLILLCLFVVTSPGRAEAAFDFGFKTPDGAVYCQMQFSNDTFDAFNCFTPNDGFWIRFTGLNVGGSSIKVAKGYSERYRGLHPSGAQLLRFGKDWYTSDAGQVICKSRVTGLTCKAHSGLSFWLGRYKGYRIYYDKPGERPRVKPLLRSPQGVWCGINLDTLEPANPVLFCWQPRTGLQLGIAHDDADQGGSASRSEQVSGYRPAGFPIVPAGRSLSWRCRSVDSGFAERCSTSVGTQVFTCAVASVRLTCKNIAGRGFWVDGRGGFYTF